MNKTCYCPCHDYPGCYRQPCTVCGHNNDDGEQLGYRQGWRLKEPVTNPSILEQEFDQMRIEEVFENIKKSDRSDPLVKTVYSIYGSGGYHGDISFLGDDRYDVRYYRDNYPGQKVFRAANLPIRTFGDFLSDLLRVGFKEIVLRKPIIFPE